MSRLFAAALAGVVCCGTAHAAVRIPGFELVHNAPVETSLATPDIREPVAVWCEMFGRAHRTIDLEQYYVAGQRGEPLDNVIACLDAAGRRGVRIRFLMEGKGMANSDQPTIDRLKAIPHLTFRLLEWAKVSGDGIIHAKFFTVDGHSAYVGSQNFDWRSLEHIDETGMKIDDPHMVGQVQAIFVHDWAAQALVAQRKPVPPLRALDDTRDESRHVFLVASPNRFDPRGVGNSEAELVRLVGQAKHEVRIEVMEYGTTRYGSTTPYTMIDDALRAAAARGVHVRLLVADWDLTPARLPSLRSLAAVPNVDLRVIRIPQASSGPIPYARVVHTKAMTIDGATAWVGTSNWEAGYMDNSRNLEIVLRNVTIARRLTAMLEQAWSSSYVKPLEAEIADAPSKRT